MPSPCSRTPRGCRALDHQFQLDGFRRWLDHDGPSARGLPTRPVSEMPAGSRRVTSISETRSAKVSCMAGRPHKGARHVIVTRPAKPVADVVMSEAAAAGMTISDYVAGVLARAVGLPQYIPVSPAHNQQELPLKSA
jgi:hypothetical protein